MGNMDLGTVIVAGLCGIGVIQLIVWIVLMIRYPQDNDLQLDLVKVASTQSSGGASSSGSHSAHVVR